MAAEGKRALSCLHLAAHPEAGTHLQRREPRAPEKRSIGPAALSIEDPLSKIQTAHMCTTLCELKETL